MNLFFNPPPPGTFSFWTDNDITYVAHHVPFSCSIEIENGGWRSISGVFCVSFNLSFRPSFSIRRWGCSSPYHRPHFWYHGNLCLSRSVCKKTARSMTCHLKSNSFWTARGSARTRRTRLLRNYCEYFYFMDMELHSVVSFSSDWTLFYLWTLSLETSISIWCCE